MKFALAPHHTAQCCYAVYLHFEIFITIFLRFAAFNKAVIASCVGFYWLQGSATRPVNSSVLMMDSLMSSRNGRSAVKTSLYGLKERPAATTAVAAAASLPSSFTCNSTHSCLLTQIKTCVWEMYSYKCISLNLYQLSGYQYGFRCLCFNTKRNDIQKKAQNNI